MKEITIESVLSRYGLVCIERDMLREELAQLQKKVEDLEKKDKKDKK